MPWQEDVVAHLHGVVAKVITGRGLALLALADQLLLLSSGLLATELASEEGGLAKRAVDVQVKARESSSLGLCRLRLIQS